MPNKLFVFGSLAQGMCHFHKIERFVEAVEPACAYGSVYRMPVGLPVFSVDGTDLVNGELVYLKPLEMVGPILDEYFGVNALEPEQGYHLKLEIDVRSESGIVRAQTYSIQASKLPPQAQLIPRGDWQADMRSNPPLMTRLSDAQKTYLSKLGKTSGREIVPIDLQLYRELMSLELIVDKGRRLALSRLGKEVCRYLA